ncbi:zinc finger protein 827 isoform X1 [Cricetulus griseus]|uniref:Zinc finger protein 827 n=2 Tax=Cricetulus griseus TaxID=10029 RepID=A0A9J7FJ10_CRIGR|nr:zinc finger protein 827 isoform X1 [Cricetulus griseus]XP_027260694.1 zinc finger protein 827 isoform X1 [Cricetulus griseus]
MPRRKQEQPKRLPSHVSRQAEAEGEFSEGEPWYGNSSETPSEASYGEVQENYTLSLEDRIQEQSTSPDTSLGSATPSSHTLELVALDGEILRDSLQCQDHLSPGVSSVCDDDPPSSNKPLSSNLRRLLEAGSLKLDATANGRVESPVNIGSSLSFSPPSHHAQQLSVLARKLAEKQDQNDQYTPSNRFIWNQGKWLPNSTTTCGLSPDSAILKLKAAANAVLQDKSLSRTEESLRFESFSSPFSSQSASSTLAALSKKVSERSLTPGQEHPPPASSFLSLASMTSSAALLKEVAARAAGSLLAEKSSLLPDDPLPLPPSEKKPEKVTPPPPPPPPSAQPQSLELLLLPVSKGRVSKPSNSAPEEESGKPFQCPICGLVIKRKSYWKRHMVIHTGLKSHQCPLCPFRCARKDNLKSHMKVHQHQDRGETFQCQLCPFTSSRHFSLKLHMRCHQHFLRTEAKVKEEIPDPDVKGSPHLSDSGCLGQPREGGGTELVGTVMTSNTPERTGQGGAGVAPLLVKEEPKEDNGLPTSFTLNAADRPANHTKLKDPSEYVSNSAAALFSQDISVKMASDFLMKLSAANHTEPMNLNFKVKEEPKEEESLSAPLPRSSYVFSPEPEVATPNLSEDPLTPQEGKGNVPRRDMSVKAASELLMKLSAESYKETQAVKVKEEPMEVDTQDSPVSISPSRNIGYSTLMGREKIEPLQKLPEGRVPPERNLFSQDISVKMASELLFQLSEKVSKEHNHTKENTIRTTTSPFFSEDTFRQSPFTSNSKDLLPGEAMLHGRIPAPETEKIVLEAGNGLPSWKFNDQLFPCDVCGKVFGRQQTLSRHLSLHTVLVSPPEERKYKCHLCPYAAKCRANLNQHLTVHSVKLVSTDTEDIVSAVTSEGSDGKKHPYYYSCHVCGFETELNVQFVSHMSLHVDKEQWMFSICCTACDFVTMEEAEIKNHIGSKHTGDDRKTPSESNSPSSSSLSTLSDSANGKDDSDSSQKNKGGNNLLVISVLPGSQSSLNSEEKPEKGFECVFCNFVCKTKNMFERHLQIHLITRMFECDVCHKFMKTPEQLLEHKKCHTVPTGGLKCPFCIYSTNRPAAMECHLKTHYKMEYKCRICQTVKANQLELETHTREHRLGNHYKCDQCGYLSKTANKLIEHVRVHTGERPFHCDQCSYSCKRKDNLNLHKKLKHAPRQTFSCGECLFKTTHPFVFSRHVKKHQSGGGPEEDKKGLSPASREPGGPGAPLLVVGGGRSLLSPLSVMSASQALQTVALSAAHGSSSEPNLAFKALAFNGSPLCLDKYRNSDFAHLIPLTMLYPKNHLDLTFHPPRPQTAPPSIPSPKHSFLAYLGLRERAETV